MNQAFDGLIPALNAKKIDAIIASMFITPEREEAIAFAGPYYSVPALFVAAKDSGLEISEDGLKRKTVGVQRGTTMADYVEATYPGARVQFYDTLGRGEPRPRRAGGSTSSSPTPCRCRSSSTAPTAPASRRSASRSTTRRSSAPAPASVSGRTTRS